MTKLKQFFAAFDPLDIFPSVRKLKADLKESTEALVKATDALNQCTDAMETQRRAISAYKEVLGQVVNDRNEWQTAAHQAHKAALEWRGLNEKLQVHFAMHEEKGRLN